MNKIYFKTGIFLLSLFTTSSLFSQNVGINTTGAAPSVNAILDLNTGNANNTGAIIPNVTLGASLATFNPPIANPATAGDVGMMVYNIGGTQAAGYYYWSGTTWVSAGGGLTSVTAPSTATSANVNSATLVAIPGLTQTINLNVTSNVLVSTNGYCTMTNGSVAVWALAYVWIDVDGVFSFLQAVNLCTYTNSHFIGNNSWSGTMTFNLAPGAHTIAIYGNIGGINNAITNAVTFAGPIGFNTESYETVTILHP